MSTLIEVEDDGVTRRCDARCWDAVGDECDCICEGVNHGVGIARAKANSEGRVKALRARYGDSHVHLGTDVRQMELSL